jgi:ubiquinone/menaquinone biosynthesis C-methylase UbiE
MGCGWQQRPFKDALAKTCKKVYAVDQHWEAGKLDTHDNMEYVIADFTQRVDAIPDNSLDRVFCISVLEELGDRIKPALLEFYRCLKPGGLCVITMDVQYDMDKPTPYCGGVDPDVMNDAIDAVRFSLFGGYDGDKSYAMFSEMYNLCVFHYVLVKR